MSKKDAVKKYFCEVLEAYGHILEQNGRTWHI